MLMSLDYMTLTIEARISGSLAGLVAFLLMNIIAGGDRFISDVGDRIVIGTLVGAIVCLACADIGSPWLSAQLPTSLLL